MKGAFVMEDNVLHLFPPPHHELPLQGLYLKHDVRRLAEGRKKPFVYANFITSLDGRIAVPDPEGSGVTLAESVTNPRDWRLFQELAVQADILIASGRYMREHASGAKQEILDMYQDPRFQDLKEWRLERGLKPQPDLAVISRSLNFEVPASMRDGERSLVVFTTESADQDRVKNLGQQGANVLAVGQTNVDGGNLLDVLGKRGYQTVYSTAGPRLLHLLLNAEILDRLYLTFAHRLLGGTPFASILEGPPLTPPADFGLHSLAYDPYGLDGSGQHFACFDRTSVRR
jgi:riboflavin biosynthesis pyrimidine reductase